MVCFGCGMPVGVEGLMEWDEFGCEGVYGMGREGGATSVGVWHPGRL